MVTLFASKEECCGCSACKNICPQKAISMEKDEEGFLYPQIDYNLCVECGICLKACALKNKSPFDHTGEPAFYALKHKSDQVRKNSSSGGAFTAISDYILSKGGVVYGAAFDETLSVSHQRAVTLEERNKFRGSKYVQSDLNDVFVQVAKDLEENIPVLFSGVPCQTAALKNFLMQSNTNADKLYMVDIICFGTPSPCVFADYIYYCQKKNKCRIVQYNFRSKINGWGNSEEAVYENGKRDYKSILSQIHKDLFYSRLTLRPSCYECKYTNLNRPSDLTIGDFWGIEASCPEFYDPLGVSLAITNTIKGKELYSEISEAIHSMDSNIVNVSAKQGNLFAPSKKNPRREEFWHDYSVHGFEFIIKKYTGYGYKKLLKNAARYILKKSRPI